MGLRSNCPCFGWLLTAEVLFQITYLPMQGGLSSLKGCSLMTHCLGRNRFDLRHFHDRFVTCAVERWQRPMYHTHHTPVVKGWQLKARSNKISRSREAFGIFWVFQNLFLVKPIWSNPSSFNSSERGCLIPAIGSCSREALWRGLHRARRCLKRLVPTLLCWRPAATDLSDLLRIAVANLFV